MNLRPHSLNPLRRAWPLALCFAACDSQADSDYRGEALAELNGIVRLDATLSDTPTMETQIVWLFDLGPGLRYTTQPVALTGDFPARFELAITEPPPEPISGADQPAIALGIIVANPKGAEPEAVLEGEALPSGAARRALVVWTSQAIPERSELARRMGGALAAGFHLLRVTPVAEMLANDPTLARCEEFDSDCRGSDDPDARLDVERCDYDARAAAGCLWGPDMGDHLAPAEAGFSTPIEVTIKNDIEGFYAETPQVFD